MNIIFGTALVVGITALLYGCAEVDRSGRHVTKDFTIGSVTQFTTDSGVDCIFAKSGYGGGLSCNWKQD